ncbi:MAG TPA: ABC transporter ATP-binding protein [Rectinemataceae bacterium]
MTELLGTRGLSHRFSDGAYGLRNLDFSLMEGDFAVLAGPSGSGKTLLGRHLVGLERTREGEAYFRGFPLASRIGELRKTVGYVFQDTEAQLIGQTVAEDLAFGPANLGLDKREVARRVEACLSATGLAGMADRRPETLSGGEKRRLAIGGALAMGCSCLILDEPFANLDFPSARALARLLRSLRDEGTTLLVATHELEKVLGMATRLIVLEAGRKIFDAGAMDAPASLFAEHGLACPYISDWPWRMEPER